MAKNTQAGIEDQVEERSLQVEKGKLKPKDAFGIMEDWIIQLGEQKAFLHPNLKQWMWYDKFHDEWVFAGCGVGEAILLTIDTVAGVKKLPQSGIIADWCVYRQVQELFGPLPIKELQNKIDSQQVPEDILIWSTRATDWLSMAELVENKIIDQDKKK